MKRDGLIVLLGIGLLTPIQLGADQAGRRVGPSYRSGNPDAAACRSGNRRVRRDCASGLDPIHVSSGRIREAATRRGAWVRVDWGDVFIRRSVSRDPFDAISQGRLQRMLGRSTVSRIRAVGRHNGLRGRLRGHWFMGSRRGAVLVVSMGGREVAQFADHNRDGWVDTVLLSNRPSARRVYVYR
jgi:hypothetical protein